MQANEAITKIKLLLGLNNAIMEFDSKVLVDGTTVETDGPFEVGKSAYVVTPEGNVTAPAGMHQTEDGMIVEIDENGMIVEIETVEQEAKEGEEEALEDEATEETVEMEEVEVEVAPEVAPVMTEEVVQAVVEALTPVVEEVAAIAEELKKMKAQFKQFSSEPAATKIKRNDFSSERNSAVDRLSSMRNKFNKK